MTTATPLLDRFMDASSTTHLIHDAFTEPITDPGVLHADDAVRSFFADAPDWLAATLRLRNKLVARLGFDAGTKEAPVVPERCEVGDRLGLFTVMDRSDSEIVIGIDDDRMEMRLSIVVDGDPRTLTIATAARPVDRVGATYLRLVRLGHAPIAAMMTKRCARP